VHFYHAIILGTVEGIAEFLPISSTGHLILTARLLHIPASEFLKSFEIIIQLGAIFSVMVLYWKKLFSDRAALIRTLVAFIPTGILGLIFHVYVKQFLLGSSFVVVWALFFGGMALILLEWIPGDHDQGTGEIAQISWFKAALIGIFQALAMIPGVSRSAATIMGGMILGLKRETAVEFSFLLAIPTMLAATGLDLVKSSGSFSHDQLVFLLEGFITSFIVAIISIKCLIHFIKHHTLVPFGIYRIIVALLFLLLIKS